MLYYCKYIEIDVHYRGNKFNIKVLYLMLKKFKLCNGCGYKKDKIKCFKTPALVDL